MPRTQVTTKEVFKFDELPDSAKEKARDWWRECEMLDGLDLIDMNADDFNEIAKLLGIEFDQRPVKLMGGGTRYESKIWYSGFSSQGDGACFEGRYSYAKGMRKAIRAHAPLDTELHRIADGLFDLQRRAFYRLEARAIHHGRYYHSGCMSVDVSLANGADVSRSIEEDTRDLLRSFADWIYRQLKEEYEYRMSDENVDESIRINEYEFDENGRIA